MVDGVDELLALSGEVSCQGSHTVIAFSTSSLHSSHCVCVRARVCACVTLQVSCIGCNTGNRYWVNKLYGATQLASVRRELASCSGFTMGGAKAMGWYLRRMSAEITRTVVPRLQAMATENLMLAKGYDQGVHNVLVHTTTHVEHSRGSNMRLRVLPPSSGAIMTAYRMVPGRDFVYNRSTGVVGATAARPFAVVHQYNRLPSLFAGIRVAALATCPHAQ